MANYTCLLLDVDNTLLDFDAYVRTTMEQGFAHFGLPAYRLEMYHTFTAENNKLWRQIEEGTLTFAELQKIRKCVDIALRADQPAQTQSRTKRQEQER